MNHLIARLEKPGETIRVMRAGLDHQDGYLAIRDIDGWEHDWTPVYRGITPRQTVERIPWQGLDLYLMMKNLVDGYRWLRLCEACRGEGWRWVPAQRGEDADRDVCPECQGKGGY